MFCYLFVTELSWYRLSPSFQRSGPPELALIHKLTALPVVSQWGSMPAPTTWHHCVWDDHPQPTTPHDSHQKENSLGYSPTTKKQIAKYFLNFKNLETGLLFEIIKE